MTDTQWILLLIALFVLYKFYVELKAREQDKNYRPPSPPAPYRPPTPPPKKPPPVTKFKYDPRLDD